MNRYLEKIAKMSDVMKAGLRKLSPAFDGKTKANLSGHIGVRKEIKELATHASGINKPLSHITDESRVGAYRQAHGFDGHVFGNKPTSSVAAGVKTRAVLGGHDFLGQLHGETVLARAKRMKALA